MKLFSRLARCLSAARFLYNQRIKGFRVPDEPYFDHQSKQAFLDLLKNSRSYLEFGSGGSTVVAAKLGVDTITVENDRFFARSVQGKIGQQAKNKIFVIDIGITLEWGFPVFQKETDRRLYNWSEYVLTPFRYISESKRRFPDLILVDGRFRRACALTSAREALARGVATIICVDDYAPRGWYHDIEADLGEPKMIGRMAIFTIRPGQTAPSDVSLRNAMRDVR